MVKDVDNPKNTTNPEKIEDSESEKAEEDEQISPEEKKLTVQQIKFQQQIETELGLARFFDYVVNEPFELIYQDALIKKYEAQLITPLFFDNDGSKYLKDGRYETLKSDFEELNIQNKYRSIIKKSEEIAAKDGINAPYLSKMKKFSLGIISGIFILLLILMAIDTSQIVQTLYMPIALVVCFFPRFIQKIFIKKWNEKKDIFGQELKQNAKEELDDLKVFIQYTLNDIRERLLENRYPLQVINFMLLSSDYENTSVITQQNMRNIPHFVLQFKYPQGMQPFEVPKQLANKIPRRMQTTSEIPEDDDNDSFILLKNPVFNEESQLIDFDQIYPKSIVIDGIEQLLDSVEFDDVDKPQLVIPNFNSNNQIKCECGEDVKLKSMKTAVSDMFNDRFEFFFIIGGKCSCAKNNFILLTSPGNKATPVEVEDIFGQMSFE